MHKHTIKLYSYDIPEEDIPYMDSDANIHINEGRVMDAIIADGFVDDTKRFIKYTIRVHDEYKESEFWYYTDVWGLEFTKITMDDYINKRNICIASIQKDIAACKKKMAAWYYPCKWWLSDSLELLHNKMTKLQENPNHFMLDNQWYYQSKHVHRHCYVDVYYELKN